MGGMRNRRVPGPDPLLLCSAARRHQLGSSAPFETESATSSANHHGARAIFLARRDLRGRIPLQNAYPHCKMKVVGLVALVALVQSVLIEI